MALKALAVDTRVPVTYGMFSQRKAPDYWRHVHNRLSAGETARAYTRDRHAAWRLRCELHE